MRNKIKGKPLKWQNKIAKYQTFNGSSNDISCFVLYIEEYYSCHFQLHSFYYHDFCLISDDSLECPMHF